jgi:hypothetical protein
MKNHLSTEGSTGAAGFGAAAGILSASSLLWLGFPSKVAFFLQGKEAKGNGRLETPRLLNLKGKIDPMDLQLDRIMSGVLD